MPQPRSKRGRWSTSNTDTNSQSPLLLEIAPHVRSAAWAPETRAIIPSKLAQADVAIARHGHDRAADAPSMSCWPRHGLNSIASSPPRSVTFGFGPEGHFCCTRVVRSHGTGQLRGPSRLLGKGL